MSLTSGPRTAVARQRTLEAVVAWSYDLLEGRERAVFRRLSVFADGFTLDAAEAVTGWGGVSRPEVIDIVSRLVDKSLIVPRRVGDEYRYGLLETLRHYGREQLVLAGEHDECILHLHARGHRTTTRGTIRPPDRPPRPFANARAPSRSTAG